MKATLTLAALLFCAQGAQAAMEYNTNRMGSDYTNFIQNQANPAICENACNGDSRCKAWTYVRPGIQGPQARCWLKHSIPAASSSSCCTSGVKAQRLFTSRWDKIAGPGGGWTTGWVPNHSSQVCGHFHQGCKCGNYSYCGWYHSGAVTYWWPQGCNGPLWKIRCTSYPQ